MTNRAISLGRADIAGPVGPLHGVPVAIEENVDRAGRATPNGVAAFKHAIAPDDAPIVRNLKRAGAIVVGRTDTPEFSFRATTVNELHGATLNPWNHAMSSGGSSGGASSAAPMGCCSWKTVAARPDPLHAPAALPAGGRRRGTRART